MHPLQSPVKIPKAEYKLNLEAYDLQLSDYRFPSGLQFLFQSERTQPVIAITNMSDRGSEHDQQDMDGITRRRTFGFSGSSWRCKNLGLDQTNGRFHQCFDKC